jgi:hypothetical protein
MQITRSNGAAARSPNASFRDIAAKISRNEGARVDHQCGWVDIIAIHAEHLGGAEVERGTQPGTKGRYFGSLLAASATLVKCLSPATAL